MRSGKNVFLHVMLCGLLICCNQVYKEWDKDSFTTLSWKKGQQLNFNPEIKDITQTYQLVLGVRHIYGARVPDIPVSVLIISPSGKKTEKLYQFQVTDAKGESLGSCAGNMCDLETAVDQITFTEPGKYQFVLTHQAEQDRIRGIMEFGLIIKEQD